MWQPTAFQLIVTGPDFSQTFDLGSAETIMGRQVGSDVLLDNSLVSRRHARIERRGNEVWITDLGSANGTYLNGSRITPKLPVQLKVGDSLKIGPFQLELQLTGPDRKTVAARVQHPVPDEARASRSSGPANAPAAPQEGPVSERSSAGGAPPAKPPVAPEAELPLPPGLSLHSQRLLNYLPGIYHSDFMSRFLGLFESILVPIEWTIDGFGLYLSAATCPPGFMSWLAQWYAISLQPAWTESQQRALLRDAHLIYARLGTRWAMTRVLEILTGYTPQIVDAGADLKPHEFLVRINSAGQHIDRRAVEELIEAHKPAHTRCILEIVP